MTLSKPLRVEGHNCFVQTFLFKQKICFVDFGIYSVGVGVEIWLGRILFDTVSTFCVVISVLLHFSDKFCKASSILTCDKWLSDDVPNFNWEIYFLNIFLHYFQIIFPFRLCFCIVFRDQNRIFFFDSVSRFGV